MLQSHDFSGSKQIEARGRFLTYQASNADAIGADERIAVRVNGQPLGDFYVGDSIELPGESNRWEVVPYAAGLVGNVLIGDGRVTTNRAGGAVATYSGAVAKSRAGNMLWGSILCPSQGAANYAIAGIYNKDATKSVAISSLNLISSAVANVRWVVASLPAVVVTQTPMQNRILGAAASARVDAVLGKAANSPPAAPADFATIVATLGTVLCGAKTPWGSSFNAPGGAPLILGPLRGLFAVCDTFSTGIAIEADVEELDY